MISLINVIDICYIIVSFAFISMSLLGWGSLVNYFLKTTNLSKTYHKLFLGIVILTFISRFINIFSPISINIVITFIVLGIILSFIFKSIVNNNIFNLLRNNKLFIILLIIIVVQKILLLPKSYDFNLYHLPNISIIKSFPLIPGIGVLHTRLAYNSSYFDLIGAINFSEINYLAYNISGAIIFIASVLLVLDLNFKKDLNYIKYILLSAILLTTYSIDYGSPDYAVSILQIISIALFLNINNSKDRSGDQLIFLLIILIYLATVKLSSIIFVVLMISININNIRNLFPSRIYAPVLILIFAVIGFFIHIYRGYIMSGMPLFPLSIFSNINLLFAVDSVTANEEIKWIYSFARDSRFAPEQVLGNWKWLPIWILNLPVYNKIIFFILLISSIVFFYCAIKYEKIRKNNNIYILIPIICTIIIWFFSAPAIRFIGELPLIAVYLFIYFITYSCDKNFYKYSNGKNSYLVFSLMMVIYLIGFNLTNKNIHKLYIINIVDYQTLITASGLQINAPINGRDQCTNIPFPCTPYFNKNLRLIDGSLENYRSGFTVK